MKTVQFRYFAVNLSPAMHLNFVTFFWQVINHYTLQTVVSDLFYLFPLPYQFLGIFVYCKLLILSPAVVVSRSESLSCSYSVRSSFWGGKLSTGIVCILSNQTHSKLHWGMFLNHKVQISDFHWRLQLNYCLSFLKPHLTFNSI